MVMVASKLSGGRPQFALMDSYNKVTNNAERQAVELLAKAFCGEVPFLRSVLQSRVGKLATTLDQCVKSKDSSLERLLGEASGGKPAAAWRNDELHSVQVAICMNNPRQQFPIENH